jgi:uncharacterized protein (TIGR02147 family)
MGMKEIDIFNYFDYREYLRDIFAVYKKGQKGFSFRSFAEDSGIKSPTYMNRVINGSRNLSEKYFPNICEYFQLTAAQARYFKTLVDFSNTKDPAQKETVLKKILTLRYSKGEYKIEDKKLHFYSKWYYPVVRELVTVADFQDDFNLLARLCRPRITAVQAQGAVKYLLKNDFIRKNPDGTYSQTHQIISTGMEVNSTILRKYYRQLMAQYMDAIDTEKRENRDISSLTMSVSEKVFQSIKKEIQDFRKRLLTMAKKDAGKPERVCLVGLQLIPRSERVPKRERKK